MSKDLNTRRIESSAATEIYISALPKQGKPLQEQISRIFSDILGTLHRNKACILQERVFGTHAALEAAQKVRSKIYADINDEVAPSLLVCGEGMLGQIAGVQVHAITANNKPEIIKLNGIPCGRILRLPRRTYLTLSNMSFPKLPHAAEQARMMFEKAEATLMQFNADFLSVPRTWIWLCDILSWYDDFNDVRNKFFTERRLIGEGTRQSMPASTGIGLCAADGSKCAMDLTAVLEPVDSIQFLQAVGKQQCALEYGSAFSRASRAATPAGETVFVSGTASIDASGATTNIDDVQGQIDTTIENVRAVFKDMGVADKNVLQAVAYCKTTEVERVFTDLKETLGWPCVSMICDICRPDLLFEVEATAMKPTQSSS
jgi:enamine deaminase RidA (YjgF/YER057c/UK114 family)